MTQPTIELDKLTFRVRKMNAIEALALRTASDMKTTDNTMRFFNDILERMEVSVGGKWLPVKDGNNYYPAGLEDNAQLVKQLVEFFMGEFLTPLFTKSAE